MSRVGILVARTILAGDISLARQYAVGRSSWSAPEARAISGACREANRRWSCGLAFEQFCAGDTIAADTRTPPIPAGTLCRFGALTVRAYADIRVGEDWDGRYSVYLTGERPSSASRSVATRDQLEVIR